MEVQNQRQKHELEHVKEELRLNKLRVKNLKAEVRYLHNQGSSSSDDVPGKIVVAFIMKIELFNYETFNYFYL